MLEAEMKAQLGAYLERLVTPVAITAYVDDSQGSAEMLSLLADITSVSSRVTVTETRDGNERVAREAGSLSAASAQVRRPSFALSAPGAPARVTFAGLPMGHEFT